MRLVAVADTHLFHEELPVPDGDVFVHAGDLCRRGDLDELREAAAFLRSLPHPVKIVVAGNHDRAFEDHPEAARRILGEDVIYLQDRGATVAGVSFWGSPWQPAYNDWAFNLPRGPRLAEKWSAIPEGTLILVTHSPPMGFGDSYPLEGRHGCSDLLARVRQIRPKIHLFGHIHTDGGAWQSEGTTFVNVTTWECERAPTVIDFDPPTGRIDLVQVPPARLPPANHRSSAK